MAEKSLQAITLGYCIFATTFVLMLTNPSVAAPSSFSGSNLECGRYFHSSRRDARIVGGLTAEEGEFPFMVSFKSKYGHFCGGSLITESLIISAAHCFYNNREHLEYSKDESLVLRSLNATLGEYSLKKVNETAEILVPLKRIHLHPKYDPVKKQNDIALIEIIGSIQTVPDVVPVCLPNKQEDKKLKKGTQVTTIGWGLSYHSQDYYDWSAKVDRLNKVDVKIWDRKSCVDTYKNFTRFPSDSFVCAGEKGRESCTGDSGGPLIRLNEDKKWELIGVVANGNQCGENGRPGIYTLVSDFLSWINSYRK